MYKILHEADEMNIRFRKDLVDAETLTRFLNHINLQSMLLKTSSSEPRPGCAPGIASPVFPPASTCCVIRT